jgi:ligand-binding SRPBCC domain-containing protein
MAAITPPPVVVRMQHAPADLSQGGEMAFTLWLGPLPVVWRARIDEVTPAGFRDRMLAGPFARWEHRHSFRPLDDHTTEVLDEVEAELPEGVGRRLLAQGMWLNLPLLFTYRAWKTRRLLEPQPAARPLGSP